MKGNTMPKNATDTVIETPPLPAGFKARPVNYTDMPEAKPAGDNLTYQVSGNMLYLCVDLALIGGESKSGKSNTIGTSKGIITLDGTDVSIGVNVFAKKK
jgi:hypothetical protein